MESVDTFDEFLESLTLEEKLELRQRIVQSIYCDICKQADAEYKRRSNAEMN